MNILGMIIEAGKTVFCVAAVFFVLYCVVAGIREYREESTVQNTERKWDLEQAEYEDDVDNVHIINDDGVEYEWALVRRKKQ